MWGATERFRTPGGGWEQGAFRDEERFAKLVGAFLNLEVENDSAASAAGAAGAAGAADAAGAAGAAGAASAPGAPGPPGMGGTGGRGGAKIDLAAILALRPAMSKKHRVGEFGSGKLTVPRAKPGTVVPENCTAEGPGLEGAVLKVPGRFTITCRDAEHEPVAPSEAEQFTIDIVGQTKPDHSLIESADGRLTVCIGCLPLITCLRLNVMRVHAIGGLAAHGLSRVPTQHSGQWHSYQRVALHRGSRGRQHRSIQVDHQGRGWTCAVHVQGGGHRALHHRGARSTWESRELPAARPGQVRLQSNCRWTRRGEQPAHGMHFGSSSHWSMHERRH